MKGELRAVTVELDLLREKLKGYLRQLFASKSEVRKLAPGCEPAQ
jgi:hypothetical protein